MASVDAPLRIAVVGCGLISERSHVPAILRSPGARLAALVDQKRERAEALRDEFGLSCPVMETPDGLAGQADAAVVAVPNSFHAPVAAALLERGIHVLCEKPLALSAREGTRLCELAAARGAVLAVGFVTRFHETTALLKTVIDEGLIGEVSSYDLRSGVGFAWATVSGFYFQRELSGGGVLMNEAIHNLDRLIHWFGDVESVECSHNAIGGVETEALLRLGHRRGSVLTPGTARFSWLSQLRNTLEVKGSEGRAVVRQDNRFAVSLHRKIGGKDLVFDLRQPEAGERHPLEYFVAQVEDFIAAVRSGGPPRVDGREGLKSVALVEEAYRVATPLRLPWSVVPS